MPAGQFRRIALCILWFIAGAVPAFAGVAPIDHEGDAALLRSVRAELAQAIDLGLAPLLDVSDSVPSAASCADHVPAVFGLLIGTDGMFTGRSIKSLAGPVNDIALLKAALSARAPGVATIIELTGPAATRTGLAAAMEQVLSQVSCGDRVFFHFGGQGVAGQYLLETVAAEQSGTGEFAAFDAAARSAGAVALLSETERTELVDLWNAPYVLLLNQSSSSRLELVDSRDLDTFVTKVRNRGADIIVSLDAPFANVAAIAAGQAAAGDTASWSLESTDAHADSPVARLLPNHGDFLAIYASVGKSGSIDRKFDNPDGTRTIHGAFTFELARLLQDPGSVSARALGEAVAAVPKTKRALRGVYRVESSNPDLVLFDQSRQLQAEADAIHITSPEPMRGPTSVKTASVEIAGVVNWVSPATAVLVNDTQAKVDANGRFIQQVTLATGANTVRILAVMRDGRILQRSIDIVFGGDVDALKGSGKRYALLIANADYGAASRMPRLDTPLADADALASVLTHKYGFVTEAALPDGTATSLLLHDATLNEMNAALFSLSEVAGEDDTVLIYYAGHGGYDAATTKAYWIPVDASFGRPYTYLEASAISNAIARIQARKVVLISDSCFSGELVRGASGAADEIDDKQRVDSLLALAKRKTRLLISSGNNEPVTDAGGQGHSIFAQALLDGLSDMPHDEFSARELFTDYVIERVTANSKQEPQFRPLDDVGHEGGDVVFVKAGE